MSVTITKETLTYYIIPAVDCWRVIYDSTSKNIQIYHENIAEEKTAYEVYAGTRTECDAFISANSLKITELTNTGSILADLESQKETLKWQAIEYIRANPKSQMTDFVSSLPWNQQGLVEAVIWAYATSAQTEGLITLPDTSMSTCWRVLIQFVLSHTDDELKKIVR